VSRRRLTESDKALWAEVAARTDPLPRKHGGLVPPAPVPDRRAPDRPAPSQPPARPIPSGFTIGSNAPLKSGTADLHDPVEARVAASPLAMDRKTFRRMKRGKLKPEAWIDLHGMTLARAHPALNRFILSAHGSGKRLVLVITGKGRVRDEDGPIPTPRGVLRNQVPHWLTTPPLSSAVQQISEAHISHGGGGAYYVYLRRRG
jgi:DNA-nicking Smr family endonuclease